MKNTSIACFAALILVFPSGINIASAQTTDIYPSYSSNVLTSSSVTAHVGCLDIPKDLAYGNRDNDNSDDIIELQRFLERQGHLSAVPNGYYGLGTVSAVRKFQFTEGISVTGRAGPQTRFRIKEMTCYASSPNNISRSANATARVAEPTPAASNITVTYPRTNESLMSEETIEIKWRHQPGVIYDILLEEPTGAGAGYIATGIMDRSSYSWKAGKIFIGGSYNSEPAEPGSYRIHLRNRNGSGSNDQYSGTFYIQERPLTITSIIPSSVYNDNTEAVVLYGSGFNASSVIRFDSTTQGMALPSKFISPDGRILVFSVPSYIRPGRHTLSVNNTYGSGATTTESNWVRLEIRESSGN